MFCTAFSKCRNYGLYPTMNAVFPLPFRYNPQVHVRQLKHLTLADLQHAPDNVNIPYLKRTRRRRAQKERHILTQSRYPFEEEPQYAKNNLRFLSQRRSKHKRHFPKNSWIYCVLSEVRLCFYLLCEKNRRLGSVPQWFESVIFEVLVEDCRAIERASSQRKELKNQ